MTEMNKRAIEILDAYGAEPENWPVHERAMVFAFVSDGEGVKALAKAKRLDAMMDTFVVPVMSATLHSDILERAARTLKAEPTQTGRRATRPSFWAGLFAPTALGASFAALLVLGIWFGSSLSTEPLSEDELFAAFGEDYGVWDENDEDPSGEFSGDRL